ncbi:hypothetical protein BDZ91DRAFT_766517 [Kalaharituber pfeilii]|nr:hypothetical protein BDZ91DRAFT_766517 [Kalaharituber pfeilii]
MLIVETSAAYMATIEEPNVVSISGQKIILPERGGAMVLCLMLVLYLKHASLLYGFQGGFSSNKSNHEALLLLLAMKMSCYEAVTFLLGNEDSQLPKQTSSDRDNLFLGKVRAVAKNHGSFTEKASPYELPVSSQRGFYEAMREPSLFGWMLCQGYEDIVRLFLKEHGCSPPEDGLYKWLYPVQIIQHNVNWRELLSLWMNEGLSLQYELPDEKAPLFAVAAQLGAIDVMEYLLGDEALVKAKDRTSKRTALHAAGPGWLDAPARRKFK